MMLILIILILIAILAICCWILIKNPSNQALIDRVFCCFGIILSTAVLHFIFYSGMSTTIKTINDGTILNVKSGHHEIGYITVNKNSLLYIKPDQYIEVGESYIVKGDSLIQLK